MGFLAKAALKTMENTTTELLAELIKRNDIDEAFLYLLQNKKISYARISELYVKSLAEIIDDQRCQMVECGTCLTLQLLEHEQTNDAVKQESLYFLNQFPRIKMDSLNKRLGYNEEVGKSLSWYGQNKNV